MLHVTVRQLHVFSAVARRLSFARAAEDLHLTPPAVSMQIKQLEVQLGLPVFERGASEVRLTLAGEYFLVHARKILASLKEAEDLVARLRRVETGRLALGMLTTAKYFLPHLLAEFLRDHPGIEVNLVEGNRETLIERIQRNEVDLAVMGRAPGELEARAEAFGVHPLGIVAPAGHALARKEEVDPQELGSEAFVIRESGSGARATMEAFFREQHIRPPILMQIGSNETIKQAVIAGMGLAFLSLHTVAKELEQGSLKLIRVTGLPLLRNWHVVHRRARTLSPVAEALRYFLIERGASFLSKHFASLQASLPPPAVRSAKRPRPNSKKPASAKPRSRKS
ncbi:MAG: LysR substrate-binding domain-containing protein [Panacagrimonas sp.]